MPFMFDSITEEDMVGEELKGNCVSPRYVLRSLSFVSTSLTARAYQLFMYVFHDVVFNG